MSMFPVYRFDIDEGLPLIVGTGGPGLGWEFALNEAVRLHCRRRGDIGWREVRVQSHEALPMKGKGRPAERLVLAHLRVMTTRHVAPDPAAWKSKTRNGAPDVLDVWVCRANAEDEEDRADDAAAS